MQQLQVNLIVPVPDDYVIINRVEYEELQTHSLHGVYWTMNDLENRIGKKQVWIKDNILYPQKFKSN